MLAHVADEGDQRAAAPLNPPVLAAAANRLESVDLRNTGLTDSQLLAILHQVHPYLFRRFLQAKGSSLGMLRHDNPVEIPTDLLESLRRNNKLILYSSQ